VLEKRFFDFSTIFLNFSGKKKSLSFFPRRGPKKESGTEIGNSLEFDFVVPPPHS